MNLPTNKKPENIIYKIPMAQVVMTTKGEMYKYYCTETGIVWVKIGSAHKY